MLTCTGLYLKASGPTGHGSRLFEGTAVDKLVSTCTTNPRVMRVNM
jgi:hypothetical protein